MRRKDRIRVLMACAALVALTTSSTASATTWHAYGVHGGSLTESGGQLTAIAGDTDGESPDYHWNKSSWATRTGEKAFYVTSDLNGLPVGAIAQFEWDLVSGYWGNAYFNIMVQDANGKRAILAPSLNSASTAGWDTDASDDTQNPYSIFEAEAGWIGTANTGWYAADWDEVKTLIIADGPFTEYPDTLDGAATMQDDPVYTLANWAAWADQAAGSDADWEKGGVMITFGQSTGPGANPDTTVIENLQFVYHVNSVASGTLVFEGALTDAGGGVYTGTIAMTRGSYFCETCPGADEYVGGSAPYVPGPDQGGFDIYAREGATAYYDDVAQGTIGADHDAYSSGGGWGDYYQPDCADWQNYELTLSAGNWYLRYVGTAGATPMSGIMDWENMYASENDTGAYVNPPADPDANDGGAAALIGGPGAGWWDMDWTWGSEAIPLEYPGFDVEVIDLGGGDFQVILTPAGPTVVWVDDDFDSSTPGWGITHFDSIQDGIDAVSGSTIYVAAGTYTEQIVIDKSVNIIGAGPTATFIQPGAYPVIDVTADDVAISDLAVTDPAELTEGIQVNSTANLTLSRVHFPNLGAGAGPNVYGVRFLTDFTGLTVTDCEFAASAASNGVYTRNIAIFAPNTLALADFSIADCTFDELWTSIYLRSGIDGLEVTGCTFGPIDPADFAACVAGIYIGDGDDDDFDLRNISVTDNTFTDYGRGVYVWNYGANSTVENFVISGNTFTNTVWSSAIRFIFGLNGMENYSIDGIDINNNTFIQDSDVGAYVGLIDLRTYDATLLTCDISVTENEMTFTGAPYTDAMYGIGFVVGGDGFYNTTVARNVIDGGHTGGAGAMAASGLKISHYADDYTWPDALDIDFVNNAITGFDNGFSVYDSINGSYGGLPAGTDVAISDNSIVGDVYGVRNDDGVAVDASGNWWGDLDPSDDVSDYVDYSPWLASGTDTSADPGFQGDFSTFWVDDDSPQTGSMGRIEEALGMVSGSTIYLAPGTYEEQVHITLDNLNLIGSGSGNNPAVDSIIQSPASLLWYYTTSADNYPIVGIDGVTGVSIENLRIDGLERGNANYRFQGIGFWNSGGAVTDCSVVNVIDSPFSGSQHGVGIYAYNNTGGPYTVNLTNVDVTNYQKGAIALNGTGLTANVVGCTTVGASATDVTAQNGIQMYGGNGGTIDGCSVTGNIYTGSGWAASGILLISAGDVDIVDTMVVDGDPAVYCQDTNADADGISIYNMHPDAGNGFYVRVQAGMTLGGGGDELLNLEKAAQPFGDFHSETKGGPSFGTLTASLTNSIITGHCTGGYGVCASNYVAADTILLNVTECDITDWAYGFVVFDSGGNIAVTANNNAIAGNGAGFYSALPGQDATNNWWGDPSGPLDDGGTIPADPANCADVADIINETGLGDYVFDEVVEYCPWTQTYPRLLLEANKDCYAVGDTVTVEVWMTDISELIRGGQFFLEYDFVALDFQSMVFGDAPFTHEIINNVDEPAGTIDYAVGIPFGGTPVSGDARMATITFEALEQICDACNLLDWRPHDPPSRLTENEGDGVYPLLVDARVADYEPPAITCPADVTVECDAVPAVGTATVTDNCDPTPVVTYDGEVRIDGTCEDGYVLERTWTATDHCGNSDSCTQTITVQDTTDPVISCPADATVECDAVPAVGTATASDNCDPAPVVTYDGEVRIDGACDDGYTLERTWTATDRCGNSSSCTQTITVQDTTDPAFDQACPLPAIMVYADAGECAADGSTVNPVTPTATDNCSTPSVTFVRSDGKPGLLDAYEFVDSPITITWTAEDDCGNTETCEQVVTILDSNELVVDVQLSPTMVATVDRCITFELWECDTPSSVIVEEVLTFTGGSATSVTIEVPCGAYECITARDTLHTLRSTAALVDAGTFYTADFTGSDQLIGGNLNDDEWIDILDFGVFSWQWAMWYPNSTSPTGDTDCSTPYPHADINGDGTVGSGDFTFIQINYLLGHAQNCCAALMSLDTGDNPITEISVSDLQAMGLPHLTVGDLNRDGWLDGSDIAEFLGGARPKPRLAPVDQVMRSGMEKATPAEAEPMP